MQINNEPATVATSTSSDTLGLDPKRTYDLAHDGETAGHVADANTIYLGFNGAAADGAAGINKFKLLSVRAITIGPGISVLSFKSAAGTPTFGVVPGPRRDTVREP